jgi:hypothetical protein
VKTLLSLQSGRARHNKVYASKNINIFRNVKNVHLIHTLRSFSIYGNFEWSNMGRSEYREYNILKREDTHGKPE